MFCLNFPYIFLVLHCCPCFLIVYPASSFFLSFIAVAIAAAIAVVALFVVLVAVTIAGVDLRRNGFENTEREGGWGRRCPKGLGGSRCPFAFVVP